MEILVSIFGSLSNHSSFNLVFLRLWSPSGLSNKAKNFFFKHKDSTNQSKKSADKTGATIFRKIRKFITTKRSEHLYANINTYNPEPEDALLH